MAINICRRLAVLTSSRITKNAPTRLCSSIYEPDYLEAMKPPYPLYPPLLVRIRGYDYPVIENYQSWIHRIANHMKFKVADSYPMPAKELKVVRYKTGTTVIDAEYLLKIYERDLKVTDIPSVRFPIFLWAVKKAIPVGVMLDIEEWTWEQENKRFIPNPRLLELKAEIEEIDEDRPQKKKKF
ncbi:hypothetical protein QAD02_004747 [Eretmocerus hayati]|uniref:Uncharacterized protein n=1 Tax=Eretmocerus hayati TaxID=131215 RepID=A0ACC2NV88_9HYME|nr:hypothetical protein QAD02_004747 [Eretmocerus hayati]